MSFCIICKKSLFEGSVRTLKEKAVQALRQTSIDRGDEGIVKSLKNVTEISIHETCRRSYNDFRRTSALVRNGLSSSPPEVKASPGHQDFDFIGCGAISQDLDLSVQRNQVTKNQLAIILSPEEGVTHFCCVECPARFTEKEHLELHAVGHTKEYRYLCTICGTGLKRREHLERHMMGHNEVRPHVCPDCGKGFKRKEHLTIHHSIHTGERNQVCPVCSKSFHRKDHLQKHLQTHSNYVLEHVFNFEDHVKQANDQVYDDGQLVIKREALDDEMIMMNESDEQIGEGMMEIEMKVEPEETKVMGAHEALEALDYQAIEKPYVCTCGKRYKRKDHLKIHSWTHVKKDKICSQCGKAFRREEQLFNHMSVHLNSSSLQLDLATAADNDVTFMRALNLRPAAENLQTENSMKMDDVIKIDDSLLVPRPLANSEKRPHACPICKKRFKRRQHLKAHENVHRRNANAIWCGLCHQGFQTDGQFQDHQCVSPSSVSQENRVQDVQPVGDRTSDDSVSGKKKDLHARMKEMGYILPESIEIIDEEYQSRQKREQNKNYEQVSKVSIPIENMEVLQHIQDNLDIQIEEYQDYSDNDIILQEDQYTMDEQNIPVPKKVYVCKFCSKPFKRKDHFKIHLHIHTGVKSFFCPDCGKGFYRKDHLQKHSSVHSKERVFVSNLVQKPKKALPELLPISLLPKTNTNSTQPMRNGDREANGGILPEITITAPSNSKLRVPLQIKVPYQMVVKDKGESRVVDPEHEGYS